MSGAKPRPHTHFGIFWAGKVHLAATFYFTNALRKKTAVSARSAGTTFKNVHQEKFPGDLKFPGGGDFHPGYMSGRNTDCRGCAAVGRVTPSWWWWVIVPILVAIRQILWVCTAQRTVDNSPDPRHGLDPSQRLGHSTAKIFWSHKGSSCQISSLCTKCVCRRRRGV